MSNKAVFGGRERVTRRKVLVSGGALMAAAAIAPAAAEDSKASAGAASFRYSLNTGTIRGQKRPIVEEVEIAAKAGYQAIEPWISEIQEFTQRGGKLADLKKRIADLGLTVESAITFSDWLSDDAQQKPNGLEAWRRDMDLMAQIGGKRICAPPGGTAEKDLLKVASRYRRLLELGRTFGVTPELELWGRSPTIHRLGEVAHVLAEAGHPDACAVLDVFHIYVGGSPFAGLQAFNANSLPVFHMNDYPADPPRDRIGDASRVLPGDGIAPLNDILRILRKIGFHGFLSLELFNPELWKLDPLELAKRGLAKMKALVEASAGK
jgi:2-keto-myo-inositol isomerase